MKQDEVIPILYEMAMTIGGEVSLEPLLIRTLQRLLYYTSFPAGFICLDLPTDTNQDFLDVRLDAAVGDYKLIKQVGNLLSLPAALLLGPANKADDSIELLSHLPATRAGYRAYLRLPIGTLGVVILMAPRMPESSLPLTLMFEPIMAHLARAILLCRHYDRHTAQLRADREQAITRADFLALHDALTQLPNRVLVVDRIQQAMSMSMRSGQFGALLAVNIDRFKVLNDIHGYEACDQILIETARRLESSVREGDTVARIGGDEFMLLLWPLATASNEAAIQAEMIAQKVQQRLNQVYGLNRRPVTISFSIGISLFHGHLDSLENLLKNAETSVFQAKRAGRNTIRFFDPVMQATIMQRVALENDLKQALSRHQFKVYYQPQADDHHQITGAEVLLRWQHPERGMVPPAEFIPMAEESSFIVDIGYWVLQSACEQLRQWRSNPKLSHLQLAVNVSAVQFHHHDFVEQVSALMAQYADLSHLLELELTESVVLNSAEEVIQKIQALKRLGLRFSIDDFGTGYSSLAYLKRLPLDQLKIDQSFVRDVINDPSAVVIVQTIIGMAQNLGLEVIAEGVETQEQLALLRRHGCKAYQGYLFGRPMPADQFEALLCDADFNRSPH